MIAHDGQKQQIRAVEADHAGRFSSRTVHTDVAPDAADHGVKDREAIARYDARFAFPTHCQVNLVVASFDFPVRTQKRSGVVHGVTVPLEQPQQNVAAVVLRQICKGTGFGAGQGDSIIQRTPLHSPLERDFGQDDQVRAGFGGRLAQREVVVHVVLSGSVGTTPAPGLSGDHGGLDRSGGFLTFDPGDFRWRPDRFALGGPPECASQSNPVDTFGGPEGTGEGNLVRPRSLRQQVVPLRHVVCADGRAVGVNVTPVGLAAQDIAHM